MRHGWQHLFVDTFLLGFGVWACVCTWGLGGSVAWGAAYPRGQATVTLVTPFNGIGNYRGASQSYVNEVAVGQWGTALDLGATAVKAVIGAVTQASETSAVKTATKATTLIVSKGARASIGAIVLQGTMLVGTYYLDQWLGEVGLRRNPTTNVTEEPSSEYHPSSAAMGVGTQNTGCLAYPNNYVEWVKFAPDATTAAAMLTAVGWSTPGSGTFAGQTGWDTGRWFCYYSYKAQSNPGCGNGYAKRYVAYPYPQYINYVERGWRTATSGTLQTKMETSLGGGAGAANGAKVADGAIAVIAPDINESNKNFSADRNLTPASGSPLSAAQLASIQAIVDAAITAADKAEVENTEEEPSQPGEGDWEYTPEQMAAAQYVRDKQLNNEQTAEYQQQGVTAGTVDGSVTLPEKESLSDGLDGFWGALSGLSIIQQLESLKEQDFSGGSCTLSCDLAQWGTWTVSFCEWEDWVDLLGNVMMGIMGFVWLLWTFHGRGDW